MIEAIHIQYLEELPLVWIIQKQLQTNDPRIIWKQKKPPESAAPFIKAWFTLNTVFSGVISATNERSIRQNLCDRADVGAGREVILIFCSFLPSKLLTNVDWVKVKSKQISLRLFILIM